MIPIAVVLVTYKRTEYAVRTARAAVAKLKYDGELAWYVGDDGSPREHMDAVMDSLIGCKKIGCHSEDFVPGKHFPGKSWNKAWAAAREFSPVVMWLEDDWELRVELDITPYVKLLIEREDIGMVRLGHLAIDLNTTSRGHNGIHYLQMWRNMPYAYSGNPHLKHQRFFDAYGPYNESVGPGDTEVEYDHRFRSISGPDIYWPVNLPGCGWSCFSHIGEHQSY